MAAPHPLTPVEIFGLRCWVGPVRVMARPHAHSEIEINFIKRGRLEYLFGGSRVVLNTGQFAVFWATVPHQLLQADPDSEVGWVTLPLATFLGWSLPRNLAKPVMAGCVVLDPQLARRAADALNFDDWSTILSPLGQVPNEPATEASRIVLLQLEARLRQISRDLPASTDTAAGPGPTVFSSGDLGRVETMAAFVAQHYDRPLTLSDISHAANLHPNYAAGLFKAQFGITINTFLTRTRLTHAQRMLATSNATVLEIAYEAGFGSPARFFAVFKKYCGVSPARYRADLRREPDKPIQ